MNISKWNLIYWDWKPPESPELIKKNTTAQWINTILCLSEEWINSFLYLGCIVNF